jgi:hypothetical protein
MTGSTTKQFQLCRVAFGLLRLAAGKIADHLDRLAMEAAILVLDKVV